MPSPDSSEAYEALHVHHVYDQIASHFSATRYKPWPVVERFLRELPDGSIGLDIGCGNGKYLGVNPNVFILASDRSENLIRIASNHPSHNTALIASNLALPHPNSVFDFAISIAVIHHLSTPARRVEALTAILDTLRPPKTPSAANNLPPSSTEGGKALIFVWALEQSSSRRGWDVGDEQDVMVPWVMKSKAQSSEENVEHTLTFHRYYHLYRRGELERDIIDAGGRIVESGYEKDNWWAIAVRETLEREAKG